MKDDTKIKTYHVVSKWQLEIDDCLKEDTDHSDNIDDIVTDTAKRVELDGSTRYIVRLIKVIKTVNVPYEVAIEDVI